LTREVDELLEAVDNTGPEDRVEAIARAFEAGWLDIPFPASRYAQGAVLPARDPAGAIRYLEVGHLPFSDATRAFHARQLVGKHPYTTADIVRDIYWFATDWRRDDQGRPPVRSGAASRALL